ncbi:unnamed protein product, partial [Ixodes hexagonus]
IDALKRTTFRRPPEYSRQVLDIGCGTGDFTKDVLVPWVHPCRKIVATDGSSTMVVYARTNYGHPAISYDVLDIETRDVNKFVEKYGKFDRIYSFFCLHWIRDQEAAFNNIGGLLNDEGESLLVFCGQFMLYDVWFKMSGMERWKDVIDDPTSFFPDTWQRKPPPSLGDLERTVRKLIANAGMLTLSCELDRGDSEYGNEEEVLDLVASIVTVKPGTPGEKEDSMREELSARLLERCTTTSAGCKFPTDVFIVHTQKKPVK